MQKFIENLQKLIKMKQSPLEQKISIIIQLGVICVYMADLHMLTGYFYYFTAEPVYSSAYLDWNIDDH